MNRQQAFLSRVRHALRRGAAPPTRSQSIQPPPIPQALQPQAPASTDALIQQLQTELTAVGGQVIRLSSTTAVTAYIGAFTQKRNIRKVIRWSSDLLTQLEIDATLEQNGIEIHVPPVPNTTASPEDRQAMRQHVAQADLGISGVTYAIAETGTLALAAHAGQMRGISLLPPVHIAIIRADQLVATMADCLLRLQATDSDLQHNLTSCISFITGPSRTGDIELNLTVGVHGPGELHLIILDST
jgi:L-lactate dehydrogenase complex protein LldG